MFNLITDYYTFFNRNIENFGYIMFFSFFFFFLYRRIVTITCERETITIFYHNTYA